MYLFKTIKAMAKNKEFRNKMSFTFFMLLLFRFMSYIPMPFIDATKLKFLLEDDLLNLASMFSGGALQNFTLMATGISSYITASIIIQLLTYSSPKLYELQKNQSGQDKIKKITVILGIFMSIINSLGLTLMMNKSYNILINDSWYIYALIAILHSIGTGIAVWIGETMTEKGLGNGVSLLIFANIASQLPNKLLGIATSPLLKKQDFIVFILIMIIMTIAVIIMEMSEKRIPLTYTSTLLREGNPLMKLKGKSYLPLKLNLTGVMPIIFASTIIQTLTLLSNMIDITALNDIMEIIGSNSKVYPLVMTVLIFLFAFFYNSLMFNPRDLANSLMAVGGVIPTIRPGKETARFLERENRRITLINAIYLSLLSLLPSVVLTKMGLPVLGVTSVMIVVGVAIEFNSNIKAEVTLIDSYDDIKRLY